MQLIEVNNATTIREFLDLPIRLYKDNPYWIRPLDKDIEIVFDPILNRHHKHGACIRWIVKRNDEVVGRIAAFIDNREAKQFEVPTGGIGFYESIDDQEVANFMFDAAKSWLAERDMEAMQGPVNFGEKDKWWGLLIDGNDREPNFGMYYHHTYYQPLFENYGYQIFYNQFTFLYDIGKVPLNEKFKIKSKDYLSNPDFRFEHIKGNDLTKYAEDFRIVYNGAWGASFTQFAAMRSKQAQAIMKALKPIMDKKLMWFGYHKDEPIAIFTMIHDLNQIYKHLNGQWNLWSKVKFFWHRYVKTPRKLVGLVFGVIPEWQRKGVEGAIIAASESYFKPGQEKRPYDFLQLNWIGDFNPKMMNVAKALDTYQIKTHACYMYNFDQTRPFKRRKIMGDKRESSEPTS